MYLDDLLDLLDQTPVITDIHPVSLCYLPDNVTILNSVAEAVWLLDDPDPTLPTRLLITASDPRYNSRFPRVRCEHDPFTLALNNILFDQYDEVASRMLCQSQVAEHIVADADKYELVVLFLVDGLSYQDVRDWTGIAGQTLTIDPCLVDTPTVTRVAFSNLIGTPTLAMRLFDSGYHHRLGFTYWTREDNHLTNQLFHTITEVSKIGHFPQIVETLRQYISNIGENRIYIQLVRTGLDGYAHAQKRKPPVKAIVAEIYQEFEQLTKLCDEFGRRACIYLTADHGILWRDEFNPEVVGSTSAKSSSRWCHWRDLHHQRDKGRQFLINREEYYCLGFPKLRRPLRIDEQGVHGGISFQESIVPFVSCCLNDQ